MSRRFRRRWPRLLLPWALFAVLVVVRLWQSTRGPHVPDVLAEGVYPVARVVDGDTLLLANGARVRLQGVDTPETVKPDHDVEPWGPEASAFTRQFVAEGSVRLQFDRERKDRYDRFLAYVWCGNRMLNEELLRAGLARTRPYYRYAPAMQRRFRHVEAEARAAQRGVWSGRRGNL